MAKLKVVQGANAGTEVEIPEEGTLTLGRRSTCDIQVPDAKASRVHAELVSSKGYYYVRDLGSRNGTRINGRRLDEDALEVFEVGDRIEIGETALELSDVIPSESMEMDIKGYEILDRIGAGGMGTVYKAKQVSMDRIVALKVLHKELCEDPDFIQRFVQEARAAGKLSHPNIVHVFDVNKTDGTYYFSMEYVDGGNIKKLLKREGHETPGRSVDVMLQAGRALAYAHFQGIVHRDVKPDNLMLTREGDVKLADLGIARTFEEQDESGKATRVYGTPHYMAPEQALGKPVDARADIYSLGATLYHMLTGRTPFTGASATDILKAHIQEELPPITEFASHVPEALCHICERMMAKKPEKRYQTMEEVIADLEKVKKDASQAAVAAPEPGESSIIPAASQQAAEFRRRRARRRQPAWKRAAGTGTAVIFLVALGVAAFILTKMVMSPGPNGGGGRGEEVEARRRAKEALQECVNLVHGGRFDAALDQLNRFVRQYVDYPNLVERARNLISEVEEKIAEERRMNARAAYDEATKFYMENPGEMKKVLEMFLDVSSRWPETPAASLARAKAQEIRTYLDQQASGLKERKFESARAQAGTLLVQRRYDDAVQLLREFAARYHGSEAAQLAEKEIARIESEIEQKYRAAEKEARDYAAQGRYGQAVKFLKTFTEEYKSEKWLTEARKLIDELQQEGKDKFQQLCQEPNRLVSEFKFEDALAKYDALRQQFDGTQWGLFAMLRIQSIQAQADLHGEIKHRIIMKGRQAPPRLPFTLKGFKRTKFRIIKADDKEITVESEMAPVVRQPVAWTDFTARQVHDIYRIYTPNPTEEEYVALGYFCQERDLVDLADEYFEKGGM